MTDSEILTEVYAELKNSSFDDRKHPKTKAHYVKRQRHLGIKCLRTVRKSVKFIEREWEKRPKSPPQTQDDYLNNTLNNKNYKIN